MSYLLRIANTGLGGATEVGDGNPLPIKVLTASCPGLTNRNVVNLFQSLAAITLASGSNPVNLFLNASTFGTALVNNIRGYSKVLLCLEVNQNVIVYWRGRLWDANTPGTAWISSNDWSSNYENTGYTFVGWDRKAFYDGGDGVETGLIMTQYLLLVGTLQGGAIIYGGNRVVIPTVQKTFTVSKDTYIDVSNAGTLTYVEVANGAGAPAVTANSVRVAKVVTDGTGITGVTDLRTLTDSGNTTDGIIALGLPAPPVREFTQGFTGTGVKTSKYVFVDISSPADQLWDEVEVWIKNRDGATVSVNVQVFGVY